ncbi:MAG: holo-ACP synthase [Anaerolineaceae bacterium]|nr:holo-ACP synthase [Anaerolineaceae bacterium]
MLRNGVDIIEIERLEKVNPGIRARFINRVYTEAEKEICGNSYTCLAGRFAAKEAVSKVLGTGIGEIRWQDIEILRGEEGQPIIKLHANAKAKENELGIHQWAISISHSRTLAIAFVIAQ